MPNESWHESELALLMALSRVQSKLLLEHDATSELVNLQHALDEHQDQVKALLRERLGNPA